MKIESCVVLTTEELETINKAYDILEEFHANSLKVNDYHYKLRESALNACANIDDFLCEYAEIYE